MVFTHGTASFSGIKILRVSGTSNFAYFEICGSLFAKFYLVKINSRIYIPLYTFIVSLLLLDCVHYLAVLKYFAKSKSLPNPNGPLSSKVKPETIASANRKVSTLLTSTSSSSAKEVGSGQRLRGSYMKFTPEHKAQVAKYAWSQGISERS